MPLTGVFPTTDGALIMVGGFKANPLHHISRALELDEDLGERAEFATLDLQFAHRPELQRIFAEAVAGKSTEYWVKRLEEEDILCAPVRSLERPSTTSRPRSTT